MAFFNFLNRNKPTPVVKSDRYKRSFDAIKSGRMEDLLQSRSINDDLRGALETIRGRCRQLALNNPHIIKALTLYKQNIIGCGIDLHIQSKKANGELDDTANDLIEESWDEFHRLGNYTLDGTMTGNDAQKLLIECVARDGEALIIKHKFGNEYKLEFVNVDFFPSSYVGLTNSGNVIYQSVEFNRQLKPVAYWIVRDQSNNIQNLQNVNIKQPDTRIPADMCFHLFEKHHPNQVRGYPWLVSAVLNLHHLNLYLQSELEQARIASMNQIFFTLPSDSDGMKDEDIDAASNLRVELVSGSSQVLPPGLDVKTVDFSAPNSDTPDFVKVQLKSIASGLNLSYSTLANDLENINFSSAKYADVQDQQFYKSQQKWFIDNFLDPLYRDWLMYQLLTGNIALPMSKYKNYCKVVFSPQGFRSVNLVETAKAALMLNSMGVMSLSKISQEFFGMDWTETVNQIARENKLLDKLDIQLPSMVEVMKLDLIEDAQANAENENSKK